LGIGLPARNPIQFIQENGWAEAQAADTVQFPVNLGQDAGAQPQEMYYMGAVTRLLQPRAVFEIGTFNGRMTAVFILNAPPDSTIYSLDLPPQTENDEFTGKDYIKTDIKLVQKRTIGGFVRDLKLESRYTQLLANSMEFDPRPYENSIELAFIDGAHSYPYVRNDTIKTARMVRDRSLVFWHDYGGRGDFAPLSRYLEFLHASNVSLYRIPGTTLAWTSGRELKKVLTIKD
ncbi:MAG: class I SAM-dependent methyltransferase, partial [Bryobacteraceae bacterium]